MHPFVNLFISNDASGFVLIFRNYNKKILEPWAIALKKFDNHHVACTIFEAKEEAERDLKQFPESLNIGVFEIKYTEINEYLRMMNEITGNSVLAYIKCKNGNMTLVK